MVEVKAFKGINYNKDKIKNLDKVMSPPYDIISTKMQELLYDKDPHNFVRLILGKQNQNDTENNNRYTRAEHYFSKWLKDSILLSSDTPAIYPYKIDYHTDGKPHTFSGFFILLKLDPSYNQVKAHEKTLSKPKADRLNLMRVCHANLEPIQLLYIDEMNTIQSIIEKKLNDKPFITAKGYDKYNHKLWKITDKELINHIQRSLSDQILFIADGHHRYQTAINFAREMKKEYPSNDSPFNYRLVILANMFDEGLSILPTHRLLKIPNIQRERFIDILSKYFTIESYSTSHDSSITQLIDSMKSLLHTKTENKFILYFKDLYYLLSLKDKNIMDTITTDKSDVWKTLDVSILHNIIIESILGITQETLEDHIKYTREDEEAIELVNNGKFDFSVLMNATKIDELKKIAEAGEHMPQKSTYFLPKMLSGLVMYKMD